ncbi:O-antigen ligase family protein [Caulobacter endophyticus]|uniref:O-antigen ligase family protein n=1 Tax=Caulobacter endophyticus TaxID=2172652 RepID=UPI00240EE73A|nr:O-antigen ligase family protein [Caulobacter endophyticus]MDG2531899.1 O-antigen ligase family protein [Caulobacter endophyticus]
MALAAASLHGCLLTFFLVSRRGQDAATRLPLSRAVVAGFTLTVALYALSAAPAIGWAIEPGLALVETAKLLGLACLFLASALWVNSRRRARLFFVFVSRAGLAYLTLTLSLYALAPTELYGAAKFTAQSRFTASFISANTAGALCGCLALISLGLVLRRVQSLPDGPLERTPLSRQWLLKAWPDVATLLAASSALILTGSRTAFLIAVPMAMLLLAHGLGRGAKGRRRLAPVVIGVLLLALFTVVADLGGLGRRFARVATDAPLRAELFRVTWEAFMRSPLLGFGPGSFEPLARAAVSENNIELLPTVGAVHNLYLQWLMQAGILGAAAMGLCLAAIGREIVGAMRRWAGRWLVLICLVSAILLLHGCTDYALEVPSIAAFWSMLLGAGLGIAATARAHARRVGTRRRRRAKEAS